jgi:hypothetical protein
MRTNSSQRTVSSYKKAKPFLQVMRTNSSQRTVSSYKKAKPFLPILQKLPVAQQFFSKLFAYLCCIKT